MLLLTYIFSCYCDPGLYKRICYFLLGELHVDLDQGNSLVNGVMSNVLGVREEWECIARAGPHKPTVSLI